MPSDATPPDAGIALGPLEGLIGYHMRRAAHAFATDFAGALAGTDMRQVPFAVLSVVDANPGINQGAAGRALGIQRANIAPLVNELVERGLIARRADETDRRALTLSITPTGRDALDEALRRIVVHEGNMLAALGADERALLLALLRRIAREAEPEG